MKTITLDQAMQLSDTVVYLDKQKADKQYGPGLFDQAVKHHVKRGLRADIKAGTTRDRDGIKSRFVDYDWADQYQDAPHFVWFDFFLPAILNSCSRLSRGLNA